MTDAPDDDPAEADPEGVSSETDDHPDEDRRYVDPDVPSESKRQSAAEGGKVLTPEELDISRSQYVEELDDQGRYVVSPGGGPPNVSGAAGDPDDGGPRVRRGRPHREGEDGESSRSADAPQDGGDRPTSPEAARTLLAEELALTDARYGIDVVARFNGEPIRHRTVSNDVVATFENLVRWYAHHVTDEAAADEVLDILLAESTLFSGRTPNLADLLERHDLGPADPIARLVEAIGEEARRDDDRAGDAR